MRLTHIYPFGFIKPSNIPLKYFFCLILLYLLQILYIQLNDTTLISGLIPGSTLEAFQFKIVTGYFLLITWLLTKVIDSKSSPWCQTIFLIDNYRVYSVSFYLVVLLQINSGIIYVIVTTADKSMATVIQFSLFSLSEPMRIESHLSRWLRARVLLHFSLSLLNMNYKLCTRNFYCLILYLFALEKSTFNQIKT